MKSALIPISIVVCFGLALAGAVSSFMARNIFEKYSDELTLKEQDIDTKLKRFEALLSQHGAKIAALERQGLTRNAPPPPPSSTPAAEPVKPAPVPAKIAAVSIQENGLMRQGNSVSMSKTYRDNILLNQLGQVLQDAKAEPNLVQGVVKGFRLSRIKRGSLYEKLGLEDNDIVLSINDVPLGDPQKTILFLNSLRQENFFRIIVDRAGHVRTLQLTIR